MLDAILSTNAILIPFGPLPRLILPAKELKSECLRNEKLWSSQVTIELVISKVMKKIHLEDSLRKDGIRDLILACSFSGIENATKTFPLFLEAYSFPKLGNWKSSTDIQKKRQKIPKLWAIYHT